MRSVFYMKLCLLMGFSRKKSKQGGWRHGIFQGFYTKSIWKVHWSIKKEVVFHGCSRKTHAEFPWVLACGLRISNGCHTILHNFHWWKPVFSGISKGQVTNLEVPGFFFQKSISLTPLPCLDFFWNSPFHPTWYCWLRTGGLGSFYLTKKIC